MTFDYLQRVVVDGQLDVEDLGNVCIQGRNDLGEEFYLLIRSEDGYCDVIEYGPAHPDFEMLPWSVKLTYDHFEFNQMKLEKRIDKFLNDAKHLITQADVVDIEQIREYIVNPVDRMFPF